jgi:hypothetical protein
LDITITIRGNEEGSFRDSPDDRGQPEGPEGSSSADL